MRRDSDLPSLRELGDRLGDAAHRAIAAEQAGPAPRRTRARRLRAWMLAGVAGALVGAGAVGAGELITGTGDPLPGHDDGAAAAPQIGVLADSAAADPGGELPWAMRVFVDGEGRECVQLGRLRDGVLGTVESGQFRRFSDRPEGPCGDVAAEGLVSFVQRRGQPAARTIVYGLSAGRGPVRVRVDGQVREVEPGALGGFVAVYRGVLPLEGASATTSVDGRERSTPLG